MTRDQANQLLRTVNETFFKIPEVRTVRVGPVVEDSSKDYVYAVLLELNSLADKKSYGGAEVPRHWMRENARDIIDKRLMLTVQTGFHQ